MDFVSLGSFSFFFFSQKRHFRLSFYSKKITQEIVLIIRLEVGETDDTDVGDIDKKSNG